MKTSKTDRQQEPPNEMREAEDVRQDAKALVNERGGQRAGRGREVGLWKVMRQAGRHKGRRPVWTLNDAQQPVISGRDDGCLRPDME